LVRFPSGGNSMRRRVGRVVGYAVELGVEGAHMLPLLETHRRDEASL